VNAVSKSKKTRTKIFLSHIVHLDLLRLIFAAIVECCIMGGLRIVILAKKKKFFQPFAALSKK